MKAAALAIALLLPLFAAGCSGNSRAGTVVAIHMTHTYHTDACPRVCMARTRTMTVDEAKALGLRPCPGCRPPS